VDLAAMIASGLVSSREVIDAHLDRIDEVNGWLNAVVRVLADEARSAADAADLALASGAAVGPLHVVRCSVKDGLDLAGHPPARASSRSPIGWPPSTTRASDG